MFMGLFLFFLGVTAAYERFPNPLILRVGLLVAFFLAGPVTLGAARYSDRPRARAIRDRFATASSAS